MLETEKVAQIMTSVVNEVNELGETPLFTAAEKGNIDVVKELLRYTTKESLMQKNLSGFDALHIACSQGHRCKKLHQIKTFLEQKDCIFLSNRELLLLQLLSSYCLSMNLN